MGWLQVESALQNTKDEGDLNMVNLAHCTTILRWYLWPHRSEGPRVTYFAPGRDGRGAWLWIESSSGETGTGGAGPKGPKCRTRRALKGPKCPNVEPGGPLRTPRGQAGSRVLGHGNGYGQKKSAESPENSRAQNGQKLKFQKFNPLCPKCPSGPN